MDFSLPAAYITSPMSLWQTWKRDFEAWERATGPRLEAWLKSADVLQPLGSALSASMKLKVAGDRVLAGLWRAVGLPTRGDQQRTLHAFHQLNGRLSELEERLAALQDRARR